MFKVPIVLIDDDRNFLDQINQAFSQSGLPSLPILFERENPENSTGIDHTSDFNTKHARIIVLDINLREISNTQNAKNLYPTIEDVLKKLNPQGPYYLIFWTRYENLPKEIIDLIHERSKDIIRAPIGWGFLDKTDFEFPEEPEVLKGKLLNLIKKESIFNLLLQWENRTNYAASETLSSLYQIAALSHDNGWQMNENE